MKGFALATVALLLLAAGCRPLSIETDFDRTASFATLRTYAWRADAKLDTGDPRIDSPRIEGEIRRVVDAELARKGFRPADSAPADFQVGYAALVRGGTSTVTGRRTLGDPTSGWGYTVSNTADYETGSFLLAITEPETDRVLWRAVASAILRERADAATRQARIGKAVREMLEDFPPE